MSVVVPSLNAADDVSDYKCDKCDETFQKRKSLKRHLENCQGEDSNTTTKQKGYPCSECDSTFRKIRTLNLHLREDHNIDPDEVKNDDGDKHQENVGEAEALSPVTDNDQEAEDSTETNVMNISVSESVDGLSDAVEAYQQEIKLNPYEITPMIDTDNVEDEEEDNGNPADKSIVIEDDGNDNSIVDTEESVETGDVDPKLLRMQNLMMNSDYFLNKQSLFKPYIQSDKSFMTFDDPTLPDGFKIFTTMRPDKKTTDKEYLTPDGFFILRSKVACAEYFKLMEQIQDEKEESVNEVEEDNVIEITSPPAKRPRSIDDDEDTPPKKKAKSGPASFKAKLQQRLNKTPMDDDHLEIIKCLPKGTKIKFAPVAGSSSTPSSSHRPVASTKPRMPEPVFKTGRGVTITPIPDMSSVSSVSTSSPSSAKKSCCNRVFMTDIGYNKHREKEHKGQQINLSKNMKTPNPSKVRCSASKCNETFDNKPQFLQHMKDKHGPPITPTTAKPKPNPTAAVAKPVQDKKVNCGDCTEVFPTRLAMLEHTKANHIIPCHKCPKRSVYRTQEKLMEHIQKVHVHICQSCGLRFDLPMQLKQHRRETHEIVCDFCPKIFDGRDKLDAHVKETHESCESCEDEFSWPEPGHQCFYTKTKATPKNERVIEQRLYRGYHFFSADFRDD